MAETPRATFQDVAAYASDKDWKLVKKELWPNGTQWWQVRKAKFSHDFAVWSELSTDLGHTLKIMQRRDAVERNASVINDILKVAGFPGHFKVTQYATLKLIMRE